MTDSVLSLRSFGVSFGDRVVLVDVSLDLPRAGMTVLVGAAGSGKSTLVRTLAGLNDAHPSLVTWGEVVLDGRPLPMNGASRGAARRQRPVLVMQHARFFLDCVRENLVSALPNRSEFDQRAQTRLVAARLTSNGCGELVDQLERDVVELPLALQRRLAIVRALIADPPVLFADEPTAGLEDPQGVEIMAMLRRHAGERSVLVITHNQRFARAAGGMTLFLAGGRIEEAAPTETFFSTPRTDLARHFVATGGCPTAAPGAAPESLDEAVAAGPLPPPVVDTRRRLSTPRGFFWVERGRLGGMPRPGIIDALEDDLAGLEHLGVSVLVTLEEARTVDPTHLASVGIRAVHFPVVDMGVPAIAPAIDLCRCVYRWMRAGEVVVFHCRAGLGRTGTLLACQLMWSGATARSALESVRAIHPRCVQSDAQVAFLRAFEGALKAVRDNGRAVP